MNYQIFPLNELKMPESQISYNFFTIKQINEFKIKI